MPYVAWLRLAVILLTAFFLNPASSQNEKGHVIFINGIQTTKYEAFRSVDRIDTILSESANHSGVRRREFTVGLVWNPIGWHGRSDGSEKQDRLELFILKTAEEYFVNDLIKIAVPHYRATKAVDSAAAASVASYIGKFPENTSVERDGKITAGDMEATWEAVRQLVSSIKRRNKAIVIAHSQGNLLANMAYARIVTERGSEANKTLRVVNVANVSTIALSGLDISHDTDFALDALKILPSVGTYWLRTTPLCPGGGVCDFRMAPRTLGDADLGVFSGSRHGFIEVYLGDDLVPDVLVRQEVSLTPQATRFRDRFEDFVYAAVGSLDDSSCITENYNFGALRGSNLMCYTNPVARTGLVRSERFEVAQSSSTKVNVRVDISVYPADGEIIHARWEFSNDELGFLTRSISLSDVSDVGQFIARGFSGSLYNSLYVELVRRRYLPDSSSIIYQCNDDSCYGRTHRGESLTATKSEVVSILNSLNSLEPTDSEFYRKYVSSKLNPAVPR